MRFLFLVSFILSNLLSLGQSVKWAKGMSAPLTSVYTESMAINNDSTFYICGKFEGTVDFDLGPGVFNLTSITSDGYLAKYDYDCSLIWAINLTGGGNCVNNTIYSDSLGNVLMIGEMNGTVDFDPSPSAYSLSSNGLNDIYIAKYDSLGNLLWAHSYGGNGYDQVSAVDIDKNLNVYLSGIYYGTVDFDAGPGTFNLTGFSYSSGFILKLDANGDFIWVKKISGNAQVTIIDLNIDSIGFLYFCGVFQGTTDFDPNGGVSNLTSSTVDGYSCRLDTAGNFHWVKRITGPGVEDCSRIVSTGAEIIIVGSFNSSVDLDPGPGTQLYSCSGVSDGYVLKLDSTGNYIWSTKYGGTEQDRPAQIDVNNLGEIYLTGYFGTQADFNLTTGPLISNGLWESFIAKISSIGNFVWAYSIGGANYDQGNDIKCDNFGNVFCVGNFRDSIYNSSINGNNLNLLSPGYTDGYLIRINYHGVTGNIFQDFNENCIQDIGEPGLQGIKVLTSPGGFVTQTNSNGEWEIDSLPIGNYAIIFDTTGNWNITCNSNQLITVSNPDQLIVSYPVGMHNSSECTNPSVSIYSPSLRRCFSNQAIYLQVSNNYTATGIMQNNYVVVGLDPNLTLTSASIPYSSLGNNQFQFNLNTLFPGQSQNFNIITTVSCDALLGQTLCNSATILPIDSCVLDSIITPGGGGVIPCSLPWDKSSIRVDGWCQNDSIFFVITNTGQFGGGDMECYSALRLYIDGQLILFDSILLLGQDSDTLVFSGDGRTWRLEVDQHPLHPGNSHPNATVELCGNDLNWTPDLVNILPQDDADPIIDIFCGVVSGSFDPNDKTGYPLGLTDTHFISPNQKLEYLIRFQNTGTDTAFTVVIRDTLEMDFNIFSVISGASSHNYSFTMHGPRVLEWTFNNIMLPDSTTDEEGSNGFVTFSVDQIANLAPGTELNNEVGIYFDFNSPVITNTTSHIIKNPESIPDFNGTGNYSETGCEEIVHNGQTYNLTGTYYQIQNDSLISLSLTVNHSTDSILIVSECNEYVLNSQTYTASGTYFQNLSNVKGCDSLITLNLIINTPTDSIISDIACDSYTLNSQTYTSSGSYFQIIPNVFGCDSLITLNLTINNVDSSVTQNIFTLTTNTSSATYQWLDCNNNFALITNETNQSFTATANGSYAVEVTENGCTDTSACFTISTIGVSENGFSNAIKIYPNPSNGKLFIDLGKITEQINVSIKSAIGQIVFENQISKGGIVELNLNVERGIYFVELVSQEGSKVVYKLVID